MEGGLSWYFAYGSNMNALRLFEERLKPEGVGAGDRIAGRLESGTVWVNGMGMSPTTPFGGFKRSGFGREGGRAGIEEFVRPKNVFVAFGE